MQTILHDFARNSKQTPTKHQFFVVSVRRLAGNGVKGLRKILKIESSKQEIGSKD